MGGRLLITGATGYIGGKLAAFYLQRGVDLTLLVRNPAKLPSDWQTRTEVVAGDITKSDSLIGIFDGVDRVIHSAGSLGHWGLSYQHLYEINVAGTLNLLTSAFKAGVKRFIHLSAGGVTGPVSLKPADETFTPQPVTFYERTKWAGENQALDIARRENLNLLVLRPTFTYGPGDPHKLGLFKAIQKGRFAYIGDGLSTVHPVHIDDLIAGIDLGLNSDVVHRAIIIGGPKSVTKKELNEEIATALGVPPPKWRLPIPLANLAACALESTAKLLNFEPPLTRSRVLALSRNWAYSIAVARELLDYDPQVALKDGIRETVDWYREQAWL